jgi:hypothetical protein
MPRSLPPQHHAAKFGEPALVLAFYIFSKSIVYAQEVLK